MSGRGGRGGGRGGRGGGRGGFQGDRPRGGPEGVAVGTLTHADLQRTVKTERLYPEYQLKDMRNPDQAESRVCVFTREMAKSLRFSPYRLRDNAEKDDMASYTDKYKQKRSLNALNLNAEQLGLEKDFFPRQIWEMYFEGKDPEGAAKEEKKKNKKKKKSVDELDEGAASQEEFSDEDIMLEDQLSEEEDYGEDDYGNNYFDAGEEEGGDDDGGGGGGDEF
ncbi:DNA-directed RNA polymerase III, subunit Rpc31 [Filobasidium floriforme]|uniref:DNA-directed RNA polymerase III, subunit Rpc31 n=1 Tax=Filobasidium floriforme TaxID=5210 RepID=UPI001E8D28C9|nr:DNA-directed RNA polymerase III, subunit Rpc31 [Filobasidium floriforme]KAH8083044.1 DNA-directed RNA polymerase III, subunit Rpc31 [Filobasidium floriforme]